MKIDLPPPVTCKLNVYNGFLGEFQQMLKRHPRVKKLRGRNIIRMIHLTFVDKASGDVEYELSYRRQAVEETEAYRNRKYKYVRVKDRCSVPGAKKD